MNIINIYEPEYVRRFQCNGGGCLCTCCIGKEIPLDKVNSKSYLKSSDETIRTLSQRSIHLEKTDLENWGVILLTSDNYCPFFDKERNQAYCLLGCRDDLHTRPKFCLDYPYVDIRWQNEIRKSLAIECPEACGLILMSQTSVWLESSKSLASRTNTSLNDVYQMVNSECITLALRSELTIAERLYAIGQIIFSLPMGSYKNSKNIRQAQQKLKMQSALLTNEYIKDKVTQISHNNSKEWQLFAQIGAQVSALANVETTPRMEIFWEAVNKDILNQSPETGAEKIAVLDNTWEQQLAPLAQEFPHILTNYLFYRLYHDSFPYHDKMNEYESYYQLVTDCFMLRNIISYWAHIHQQMKKSKVVEIVNVYHRWRRQYTGALQQSADSIKECGFYHPDKIIQLLRYPKYADYKA